MRRNIEIQTTQNVIIEYEIAGAGIRFFAYFIDLLIILFIFGIFTIIEESVENSFITYFFITLSILITSFYTLLFEIYMQGQTPGKKITGLRVIKTDGTELKFKDYFSRWALRILDIYMTLGSMAVLLINASEKGQRLGDMAAGTSVIRIRGLHSFSLNQILELNEQEKYVPEFPEVKQLNDEDVLLIKNVLIRERNFSNQAHREAVDRMFDKIIELTGMTLTGETLVQRKKVLRQMVRDYIMLTR
jgi:uncharacterized RDD family membrane protein YckC